MPATATRPAAMNPGPDIRDTLFGDLGLIDWPGAASPRGEPWDTFVEARAALANGHSARAVAAWQRVVDMPGLESRHYAQAWHFLREQGVAVPAGKAKQMLGIVLEVSMNEGVDLLAAYPDGSARYYNYSGAGVIWEHANRELDKKLEALLTAAQRVLDAISPWEYARPLPPPPTQVRMNVLSPAGLHVGQASFESLCRDPLASPVIDAGVALIQALVEKRGR